MNHPSTASDTPTDQILSRELRRWLERKNLLIDGKLQDLETVNRKGLSQLMGGGGANNRTINDDDVAQIAEYYQRTKGRELQFAKFNTDLPLHMCNSKSVQNTYGERIQVIRALPPTIKTVGELADIPSGKLYKMIEGTYGANTPLAIRAINQFLQKFL